MNTGTDRPRLALDIGMHQTVITAPDGSAWTLPVGTTSLWPLAAAGPSALAVERGIQIVEDAIERIAARVPKRATLEPGTGSLAPMQRGGAIAGLAQWSIPRDEIEREYQWLAARAVGAPSARRTGFDEPSGDAVVLILRELMHHLDVDTLRPRD